MSLPSPGWNLPYGCDDGAEYYDSDVTCPRCGAGFSHQFGAELGGRCDDGWTCPECDYAEDGDLPGDGYCPSCWYGAGALVESDGACPDCAESAREDTEAARDAELERRHAYVAELIALTALIGLFLSGAAALGGGVV